MSTESRVDQPSVPKQTARPTQPLVFKMRAEFRRSAVYLLIGMALIVAVCCVIVYFFPAGSQRPAIPFVLPGLAPIAVFGWRLRVDASGIARRRLFRWDLWPWEAFERGKVLDSEGESTSYLLPDKPFWARKLTLDLLEDSDCEQVASMIDRIRVRPDLDLPAELTLRYGHRKEALIAPGGLLLRDRGEETRYSWNDVQTLRIRRRDNRRRDFESLDLVLPDCFGDRDDGLERSRSRSSGHCGAVRRAGLSRRGGQVRRAEAWTLTRSVLPAPGRPSGSLPMCPRVMTCSALLNLHGIKSIRDSWESIEEE
jgi:hypothetical protein